MGKISLFDFSLSRSILKGVHCRPPAHLSQRDLTMTSYYICREMYSLGVHMLKRVSRGRGECTKAQQRAPFPRLLSVWHQHSSIHCTMQRSTPPPKKKKPQLGVTYYSKVCWLLSMYGLRRSGAKCKASGPVLPPYAVLLFTTTLWSHLPSLQGPTKKLFVGPIRGLLVILFKSLVILSKGSGGVGGPQKRV